MSYLNTIKAGAIAAWHSHSVLPSVTGAQAALESGWGTSSLSKPPNNNHFGIKASADWSGRTVPLPTREYVGGQWITITASFRAYDDIGGSMADHAAFFTSIPWRVENYKNVVGEQDYKKACWALQNAPAPYATDKGYAQKLINLIENNGLHAWDKEALSTTGGVTTPPNNVEVLKPTDKTVGGTLTSAAREYIKSMGITVIGDSLGVGTRQYLSALVANSNFDVLGSRQITHATNNLNATHVLTTLKNAGTLKEFVVVIIGTNRGVTAEEINNFVAIAGTDRKVLFVDTASEVNHAIRVSSEYKSASTRLQNVFYVNWSAHAANMIASWYSADGASGERIHMTPAGYSEHANFIGQGLYETATADFTERIGEDIKELRVTIKSIELNTDGIISYPETELQPDGTMKPLTTTKDIGIKGFYSPMGDDAVYNPEANQRLGLGESIGESNWIETILERDEESNATNLLLAGLKELQERSEPGAQYTVSLLEMPESISIGDTGVFVDHEFNPPLYIRARVLSITTSETNPSLNKVTIGNVEELHPQDKSEVYAINRRLQASREELRNEWIGQREITASINSTNGLVLGDAFNETQLIAQLFQGGTDVSPNYNDYRWERASGESAKDAVFNANLTSETSNTLTVQTRDIINNQTKFVVRIYNEAGELMRQAEADLKRVDTALWVDTDEPPAEALNGSNWTKPDGTQWTKVDNDWEERVDQELASQIVRRDGVTVTFGNVEPPTAGKQGDVWFKLNADGTESIMRHNGTEYIETVTNAMNADGIIEGTMDFSIVTAINITASSITAGHAEFLEAAFTALNSKATLNGAALRILNNDGSFIEMNNIPEIRSTAPNGTSIIMGNGRVHFYDNLGNSKGYVGTDMHGGTRDFGTFLSKGSGIYRFARMADVTSIDAKYYTVEPGDYRVSIITKLVQRGLLPDGDAAAFVQKSNMIARLNGWPILPQQWPTLRAGQQIKYAESSTSTSGGNRYYTVQAGQGWNAIATAAGVPLQQILDLNNLTINDTVHPGDVLLIELGTGNENEEAYEDIWKFGPSSGGDWRVYFLKHARFEGGFTDVSDRRIKYDIEPSEIEALEEIEYFDFKKYKMLSDDRHIDLGLIAQEAGILRVADDELEGIDIQKGIMLALKGVQELNEVVKMQADEIAYLKEKLRERGL